MAILKYEIPCPELCSFSWECFISREQGGQAGMCSFSYFSRAGGPGQACGNIDSCCLSVVTNDFREL